MRIHRNQNQRGAALILEIIIYLVIVALIAVAVTSGVRALRDLAFANQARHDITNLQSWVEGKYSQDNKYPGVNEYTRIDGTSFPDAPALTFNGNRPNQSAITSQNGANSGYCLIVWHPLISDDLKSRFWVSSANPSKIMQQGTGSNGGTTAIPPSGITGLACPW